MRDARVNGGGIGRLLIAVVAALVAMPSLGLAENVTIFLPPSRGANVLSAAIDAQARYLVSKGAYLESAAIARRINAEAASQEMDNAVKWVHTYFQRRQLNREYRRKENPPYRDKVAYRYSVEEDMVLNKSYELVKGDLTRHLNWLLDALAATAIGRNLDPEDAKKYADVDRTLTELELRHIVLTESSSDNGRRLSFRAGEGDVLETRWPFVLRNPEFDDARAQFDKTRDEILATLRRGEELSWSTANTLRDAVDSLSESYSNYYGGQRGEDGWTRRMANHQDYLAGRRYLEALALAVGRLILLNEGDALAVAMPFKGNTVIELVNFMCQRGLQFAPPEPGCEGTYRKLFFAMRDVYLKLIGETSSQRYNTSSSAR